jgi:anti-sigma B factor antagonist
VSESTGGQAPGQTERTQIVTVQGELDIESADSLYGRGRVAIGRHPELLLLDLAGVSFCDSSGLNAFVRIANEADAAGCRYALVAPRPMVLKVLRITGLDQRLPVFRSIQEARLRFAPFSEAAAVS